MLDYIPLRGCIKVAARGLKRTKVPCDYVMRTILSFDGTSVQRSLTAGKKLSLEHEAYSTQILRAKEMFF